MKRSTLAYLLLLGVVIVWGATFTLIKSALRDISPFFFNLVRMSIAFLVLAIVNLRQLHQVSRRTVLSGFIVGIFLAAGYQFQTAGLTHTTPAKSAFITGMVVIFVPLCTVIPALRPAGTAAPNWSACIGALFAFAGLLLLTTPPGTRASLLFSTIGPGDLLTLVCAVSFAGHLLALAHFSPGLPASQIATLQIGFAAALMALTLPLGGAIHFTITWRLVTALAVTSLLATAAAFTVQSWVQQQLSPTQTAILLTLEPVFASLTSLIVLHEHLGSRGLIGAGLILAGIACIELLSPTVPMPVCAP